MIARLGGRAAHRQPTDADGIRRAAATALVAALAAVLLVAGIPALARWTSTSSGSTLSIQAGTLSAGISEATSGTTSIGSAPTGVVVRASTPGMVPGVQAQTLSYAISNGGSTRAPATPSVRIVATVADSAAWTAIQPYLTVTAQLGSATTTLTTSGTGIAQTIASTTPIAGGGSTPLVLTFSLPATSGGVDLLRTLQSSRSSTTSIRSILAVQPQLTLTQVPKP